ncbi:MAG: hypothetical protein ACO1PM_08210 [Acidovorax sp.]
MSAVAAAPTSGVDTLAAWLTAYLAAPASAGRLSFTVSELLDTSGLAATPENILAVRKALPGAGLKLGVRTLRPYTLAWHRPRPWPGQPIDHLEARAREAVQATAERAAARHWALFREGSLDILGRLSCAIAIHKLQAQSAIDIPEARP